MERVEREDTPDGVANAGFLATKTVEEEEDGGLDEGEDGVVEDLGNVEPPEAWGGVKLRYVGATPAEVVELDV